MQFSQVVGKEVEKKYLISSIEQGRLAHAQLFSGNIGSGQLALAWATASYILCLDKQDGDSCGKCTACIKTSKLAHPDLHFAFPVVKKDGLNRKDTTSNDYMDLWRSALLENPYFDIHAWARKMGAENSQPDINKEECSNIISKLTLKPFESEYKVVILWMPEYLNKEGNRLLKIIEEPTPGTYFILVSDGTKGILNTILSRTQLLKVSPFSSDEISENLTQNYEISVNQATPIVLLSDGNMSKAVEIVLGSNIDYSSVFLGWLRACYKLEPVQMQKTVNELAGMGKEAQKNFLEYGIYYMRQLILAHQNHYDPLCDKEQIDKMKAFISSEASEGIVAVLDEGIAGIRRNINSKILFMADSITIGRLIRSKSMKKSIFA